MIYLAITQGTAEWLVGKSGIVEGMAEALLTGSADFRELERKDFVEGPFRIAASEHREVIAVWNTDYFSGTGAESWGFILVDSQSGLLGAPQIFQEVLERCAYVINQRLQGLLLDGAYIHRSHDNAAHTLLAGRGSKARRYSLGYFEQSVDMKGSLRTCVLCVGPINDPRLSRISNLAASEASRMPRLASLANQLVFGTSRRQVADQAVLAGLRAHLRPYTQTQHADEHGDEISTHVDLPQESTYGVRGYSYDEWSSPDSPLTSVQRRILNTQPLDRHPLRIIGPGGSGKTLLMQLLSIKLLQAAEAAGKDCRILYVVHNSAMREKVRDRFGILLRTDPPATGSNQCIDVSTLSEYGRGELQLEMGAVIDADASAAKAFQHEQILEAMNHCLEQDTFAADESKLLLSAKNVPEIRNVFAKLLVVEISVAIKGHGLEAGDRKRYVESAGSLSRLHGALNAVERGFVFDVFTGYHRSVFEKYGVLDTDDVALSLLGRLRTPLWQLKRMDLGYDYIFVDETQLFNENERRVLPYLTKGATKHVPIALALDEAQQMYGQTTAGLATLGIKNVTNESLPSIHRSTKEIVQLAFFVIQRCTDLFNADFPDFTGLANEMSETTHPLARNPRFEQAGKRESVAELTVKTVNQLRQDNYRQIAVVCHADQYWSDVKSLLGNAKLALFVVEERGQKLPAEQPLTVLARPAQIGGQEFDAVILVGLEQGVVPPRISGNDPLAVAVEQQAFREMYLSITRARFALIVALSHGSSLTPVLRDAAKVKLLSPTGQA